MMASVGDGKEATGISYRRAALGGDGGGSDGNGGGDVGSLCALSSSLPPSFFFPSLSYSLFLTKEFSRLNEICFSKIMITLAEPNRQLPSLYPDLVFGEVASLTSIVRAKNDL